MNSFVVVKEYWFPVSPGSERDVVGRFGMSQKLLVIVRSRANLASIGHRGIAGNAGQVVHHFRSGRQPLCVQTSDT